MPWVRVSLNFNNVFNIINGRMGRLSNYCERLVSVNVYGQKLTFYTVSGQSDTVIANFDTVIGENSTVNEKKPFLYPMFYIVGMQLFGNE